MKKVILVALLLLFYSVLAYSQTEPLIIYLYDYADYPETEKRGKISSIDDLLKSQGRRSLKYKKLDKTNRVNNTYYYDIRNNINETFKIAIEVNWKHISEVNLVLDRGFQRDNFSLFSQGITTDIPSYLLTNDDSISTHFIFNRVREYLQFNVNLNNPALGEPEKDKILDQLMEDILFNKLTLSLEVRFRGDRRLEKFILTPRNYGFSFQFQNKVDLSLSYVNKDIIGNVFISAPFRLRTKKPTKNGSDLRWLGDVISFGPTFVLENSSSRPVGFGGFMGLGLSENGQMILGITGGLLFSKTENKFYGVSYNAIGFIDGMADLFNGKPAWEKN